MGPLGDEGEQTLHEVQHMGGIALDVLLVALVDDIVQADDQVRAQEEGVVRRSECGLEIGAAGQVTLQVLVMVMVADHGIERDAGPGNLLLIGFEQRKAVPADIAEGDPHRIRKGAVVTCLRDQVLQRLAAEKVELPFRLELGVGDGKQGIVIRVIRPDEVEVESFPSGRGSIELRRAGGEVGGIAGRGHHIYEGSVGSDLEFEASGRISGRESAAVRHDDIREREVAAVDRTLHLAGIQSCRTGRHEGDKK